ncbi:hypothetical protein [Streptomyces sp. NPDC048142]|uniref:hypothetical protein n=1 Tax=Streptomyces sp. NPDC048142 TaxID=3365501 RepID=UPI00371182EF
MKRRWGLSLLLSILALHLEAALALVVSVVYGVTQESPNTGVGGSALFVLLLPVLAVFTTVAAAALSVALVFPTAWLSDVLGRRFGGREVWWWVLPVAAAVSLVLVGVVVALSGGAEPAAAALGWLLTTAALTVPALCWRSRRTRIFGPVTLWGLVAVVLTAVLGGVGLSTGLLTEYRPPAVTSADIVGRWSDGQGGTLTFTADGRVTADGIDDDLGGGDTRDMDDPDDPDGLDDLDDLDDDVGPEAAEDTESGRDGCTGQGTWTYDPGGGTWSQEVEVTIASCTSGHWNVGGTESRPTLYQYIGDPDSWDLYRLTRTAEGS